MANEVEIVLKATDKASATIKGMGANVKGSFTELSSAIGVMGKAFKGAQDIVSETVGYTMNLAKQVRTLKTEIGATPEEASKLIEVAGDMGVEFGQLETALKGAIRKGISPTIQGIGELSDAYLKLQPGVERTKFLMDNFGRSGADIARLMELGSAKIKEMGDSLDGTAKVMDEKALQAAEEYRMAMENFNDQIDTVKLNIGRGLIPALTQLTKVFTNGGKASHDAAGDFLDMVFAGTFLESSMGKLSREAAKAAEGIGKDTNEIIKLAEATKRASGENVALTNTFNTAADAISQYSVQLLYNKATQDLDYQSALMVGRALGLVDEAAIKAAGMLDTLRASFDSGAMSAEAYAYQVQQLNAYIQGLKDKTVYVTTIFNNIAPGGPPPDNSGNWTWNGTKWVHKQSGGSVSGGGAYIVGEAGPELFVPNQSGSIVPNNKLGAVGGGITINVTGINDPSAVAAAVVQRLNRAVRMGAYNGRNYAGR